MTKLQTLKDLKKIDGIKIAEDVVMRTRTLDYEEVAKGGTNYFSEKDLKQMAIEWAKERNNKAKIWYAEHEKHAKKFPNMFGCPFCKQDQYDCGCYNEFCSEQWVIMQIFNLTEEDLKETKP